MDKVYKLVTSNAQYKSAKDAFDDKLNELSNKENWQELLDLLTQISEKVVA